MKFKELTKDDLNNIISKSYSKANVLSELGMRACGGNYKTLDKYISKFEIDTSHFTGKVWNQGNRFKPFGIKYELKDILIENSTYSNITKLKKRLIDEGLKHKKCEICNLSRWLDLDIPLELDHISGINNDNRIENLRILCPNCHAQTDTYRGKNKKQNAEVAELVDAPDLKFGEP